MIEAIIGTVIGTAVVGGVGAVWAWNRNYRDSKKIYDFMTSESGIEKTFRSKERIASDPTCHRNVSQNSAQGFASKGNSDETKNRKTLGGFRSAASNALVGQHPTHDFIDNNSSLLIFNPRSMTTVSGLTILRTTAPKPLDSFLKQR